MYVVLVCMQTIRFRADTTVPMFAFGYQSYGEVERELQEMAAEHGTSADELVELVRINEETMEMMRVSVSCIT